MPASPESEDSVLKAATGSLKRWLGRARDVVMTPWRRFRAQPDPGAIASTKPMWQAEVDRILEALDPALREGWAAANLPGNFSPDDPFIQANLALTKNLLVRIPDEVHAQVVAAILAGVDAGDSVEQVAERVEDVLTWTGSENWPNRARIIAMTETTRHYASAMLAHGLLRERAGELGLMKQWDTRMDGRERSEHREANDQRRPLSEPFLVGGELLLFPAAPNGSPSNVCNCRCGLELIRVNEIAPR